MDGPDVWEIVRDLRAVREAKAAADPILAVAEASDLSEEQVRLAAAYHATYPDEIDARIAAEDELGAPPWFGLTQ